jgi:tRNA threonylcarbamoyladenosine biosynthesis protein TsaE
MKVITKSDKETISFAKKFVNKLKGGEVIGLIGELGAGKTVFTKGVAQGLGIKNTVNSPTFVLMKIYKVTNHKTVKQLCHIDAYRINNPVDLTVIGIEEYFNRPDTITVIEWADKIKKILPKNTRHVNINTYNNNKRIINY